VQHSVEHLSRYITGHFTAESFTQSTALLLKLKATRRQTQKHNKSSAAVEVVRNVAQILFLFLFI